MPTHQRLTPPPHLSHSLQAPRHIPVQTSSSHHPPQQLSTPPRIPMHNETRNSAIGRLCNSLVRLRNSSFRSCHHLITHLICVIRSKDSTSLQRPMIKPRLIRVVEGYSTNRCDVGLMTIRFSTRAYCAPMPRALRSRGSVCSG